YAVFVVATSAFRIIYGETEDSLRTASGTWVLTAAGGATLLVFAYRIFVSPEDDRGVTRRARLVLDESWLRSLARCSGVLAVVGAMALAGSIFASFDTMGSGSLSDVTALLVYQAVFAAGLFLAGALIARDTSRHTGAAALVVVAAL